MTLLRAQCVEALSGQRRHEKEHGRPRGELVVANCEQSYEKRRVAAGEQLLRRGEADERSQLHRRTQLRRRGIAAVIPEPSDQIAHRKRRGSRGGRPRHSMRRLQGPQRHRNANSTPPSRRRGATRDANWPSATAEAQSYAPSSSAMLGRVPQHPLYSLHAGRNRCSARTTSTLAIDLEQQPARSEVNLRHSVPAVAQVLMPRVVVGRAGVSPEALQVSTMP